MSISFTKAFKCNQLLHTYTKQQNPSKLIKFFIPWLFFFTNKKLLLRVHNVETLIYQKRCLFSNVCLFPVPFSLSTVWSTKIVSHKLNFCVAFFHTSTTMFAVLFTMFIYYQPHFISLLTSSFFGKKIYIFRWVSEWEKEKCFDISIVDVFMKDDKMYTGKWEDKRSYWKLNMENEKFYSLQFWGLF